MFHKKSESSRPASRCFEQGSAHSLIGSKRVSNEKYLHQRFLFLNNNPYFLEPFNIRDTYPSCSELKLPLTSFTIFSQLIVQIIISYILFGKIRCRCRWLFQLSRHLNQGSRVTQKIESCMNRVIEANTVELPGVHDDQI